MDVGLRYTYKSLAFPRYHYFQTRLQRLVPRWQNILDAGGLPDCISQGTIKVKEITSAAQQVTDEVTVNLFADAAWLKKREFGLPKQSIVIGRVKVEDLQWTGYTKDLKNTSSFQPSVTVIVTQSEEKVHEVLAEFTEPQLSDVIIYNDQTKAAVLYTDLNKMDVDGKSAKCSKSLTAQVQYLLEEKVIIVLEKVTSYIREFVPRQEEELDSSLLDSIHMKLIESLRNPFVVKDLSPDSEEITTERIPTDKELFQIAEVIVRHWEGLAILLGITQLEIENIKTDTRAISMQSIQMLQTWRKKEGSKATLKELFRNMEEMNMDISDLKTSFEGHRTDLQKDEIFHKKLTDFVVYKTKCVACDTLSKRYGISASLINEFLNAGFFDYEAKLKESLSTIHLPKWPRDKTDNGVSTCRIFSYRCAMSMTKIIHSTEDYIKAKLRILVVLKKLQFELFGLLSQADVPVSLTVPVLPRLTPELQYELLKLEEVTGCGTCFGELMLHLRKTLYPARKEDIRQILKEYKYSGGFKSEMMEEKKEQVRIMPLVLEQGQELRGRRMGADDFSYGSLGCFFHLKPNRDKSRMCQGETGAMISTGYAIQEAKDHCLTCAHCLKDCEENIEVRTSGGNEYSHIGTKKCFLYNPEALDVASVQVLDDKLEHCDSGLKRSDRVSVQDWKVFDVDPIRRDVHKEGCRTGFTRGLVMSTDYMTEKIMDYNILKFKRTRSFEGRFQPSYNILIESLPGAGEQIRDVLTDEPIEPLEAGPFSLEGDSGSVIIADDADTVVSVNAVALLLGAVVRQEQFLHSYASLMKKTIEEVEVQYDCTATPSKLRPGGRTAEGAVGGGAVGGGAVIGGQIIYERAV
ncbi:uncharacterized protein LOC123534413 [Mercenaria mercenaria]|uniref:uncharacterized protein LOC123534413 n=1 Tax=Mercenaria mercenaria TaxID=6596 RepID=UPI00234F1C71|nr:uncharacterized protein LOC123534413 [Mercenaria mercenaria]